MTGKLLTKLQEHNGWGCSHSVRVSSYAVGIGKYLGLDEDSIDELFTAALLHDIGKLFIPARLLDKTGVDPMDIDVVICATVTPDMFFPSTGNLTPIRPVVKMLSPMTFRLLAADSFSR